MLSVLKDAIVLFLRKIDIFIVFITPVFLINIFLLPSSIKILLNAFAYCITSLSIYLYLLHNDLCLRFFSFRLFFSYFLADSAITAGYFIFVFIILLIPISTISQVLCFYLLGLYFLCRLSLIPALIAAQKKISIQDILFKNKNSYFQWMSAATVLYLPFFLSRVFIPEGISLAFITSLQTPLLCCFYVCYLKKH